MLKCLILGYFFINWYINYLEIVLVRFIYQFFIDNPMHLAIFDIFSDYNLLDFINHFKVNLIKRNIFGT